MEDVKVLMLGWELPPYNSGGLGVACMNLSRALANDGASIDFVIPYTAEHKDAEFMNILPATTVQTLENLNLSAYSASSFFEADLSNGNVDTSSNIRALQHDYCDFVNEYLMEYKPDVVHAHDWLTFEAGILAKKNYGVPFVAHVHATEFDRSGMNGGNQLVMDIEREGLLFADKIIAVSQATKDIIVEKYGIPEDKIDIVYNSLDEDFAKKIYDFDDDDYAYIEEMKKKGYTIVSSVGRFTVQKGLTILMRAAAMALSREPKVLFVFAGDGEQKHELIELAARYGISKNVIFTGFVRGKQLRDIYALSDIFVMSSVSEPFGLTALEAASYNNALILTKQSGVSEVVKHAITYDFWDVERLATDIVNLATDKALRGRLSDGASKEYRELTWSDVAKKIEKIYQAVDKHTQVKPEKEKR